MRASVWPLAASLVLALQAALILTHEPWLDEWQALQIAVQSATLGDLQANLRYEGHPPLWYWILRLLAEVGPYAALPGAALIFGLGTQAIILFASPFPRWVRVALALSEIILFEFNTISRSFTMGVLLIFATLALWQRPRLVWLPIALLPLADFLFGVISGIFAVLLWLEGRRWWPGIAAWLALSAFAGWSVLAPPDIEPAILVHTDPLAGGLAWLFRLGVTAFPFQYLGQPEWNRGLPFNLHLILWIPFLVICYEATTGRRWHRLALFGFMAIQIVFSAMVYPMQIRHAMLTGVLLVALQWLRAINGERMHPAVGAWLAVTAACGLAVAAVNFVTPFDNARRAGERIRALGLAGKHWLSFPDSRGQGVTALTGIRFARLGEECLQDFVVWNNEVRINGRGQTAYFLRDKLQRHGRFYVLSDGVLYFPGLTRLIERIPGGYNGQRYYLYVVGPNASERQVRLPPCAPHLQSLASS
jgi:hypothetical protein